MSDFYINPNFPQTKIDKMTHSKDKEKRKFTKDDNESEKKEKEIKDKVKDEKDKSDHNIDFYA